MADEEKIGTRWQSNELDAIVVDYFTMLEAELAGQAYSKAGHSRALMAKIGRTHRSVEFKHQNISAVLDELGLPRIRGYMPKRNYQGAIVDAIERYLSKSPDVLDRVPKPEAPRTRASEVFVQAPQRRPAHHQGPEGLQRLVRRFDPAERDYRNRRLGEAGEEFVVELERKRLAEAQREDLARWVRWVA